MDRYLLALVLFGACSISPSLANDFTIASADWPTVTTTAYDVIDDAPRPKTLQPPVSDKNLIDMTVKGDTTILPKEQLGGVYLRGDEVVHDPNAITGGVDPIIPPSKLVLKALVDSKTIVTGSFLERPDKLKPSKVVASTKTTYTYLLEGGGHVILDSKVQDVKDLRNWILAHPKQARFIAFGRRWYGRTKWVIEPVCIIANALIIRSSL